MQVVQANDFKTWDKEGLSYIMETFWIIVWIQSLKWLGTYSTPLSFEYRSAYVACAIADDDSRRYKVYEFSYNNDDGSAKLKEIDCGR